METIIIFLLLIIIGMLIAYALVSAEIYSDKLNKLEREIYDTKCKLNEKSNKLRLLEKEVDNTDLKNPKYLELYNSYKRIKKVIANADTSTTTKRFFQENINK